MLENYITQLTKDLELEGNPFSTEVPGVYNFPLEEGLSITITDVGGGFSLKSTVAPYPRIKEESFLTQAMNANLFGQGTRGAVLGLTQDGNFLQLTQTIQNQTDYKEFREILEDFINSVDFWHDEAVNHK